MAKKLDPNFVPWKKLLHDATTASLYSTVITVLQVPHADNDHMAVVHARVVFEDGRSFEDVGDATPSNCNDSTRNALLRMASTRAKARCLRDALNVGEVADVELSDYGSFVRQENNYAPQETGTAAPVSYLHGALVCSNHSCGKPLTQAQYKLSERAYGAAYCPSCQKLVSRIG